MTASRPLDHHTMHTAVALTGEWSAGSSLQGHQHSCCLCNGMYWCCLMSCCSHCCA